MSRRDAQDLIETNERLEDIQLEYREKWKNQRVRNPVTGNMVRVGSLSPKDMKKYRPRAAKGLAKAEPAGGTSTVQDRAKKALKGVWHAAKEPFEKAWKLTTDKQYRKETAKHIVGAVKSEIGETKTMAGTFRDMMMGRKVTNEAKKKAVHQLADVAKTVLIGLVVKHFVAMGAAKAIAALVSPVDEVAGIAIDKPLRWATKRLLNKEHGLLPSAFYEAEERTADDLSDDEVLDAMVHSLMQELAQVMPGIEDEEQSG